MKNRSISYIHLIWIHSFSHIARQWVFFKQFSSVHGVFIRFIKTAFLSVCFYWVMNEDRNNVWKWASAAVIKSEYIYHNWSLWSVSEVVNFDRTRSSMRTVTGGGGKASLCGFRWDITGPNLHRIHHASPYIKHILPTGCTIRSLLSGLESGGCVGSKKWALSHWIMPLFQLLWPGMPNFTARYSSLCVNQSSARGRGAQ